jgi:hypothetical protein
LTQIDPEVTALCRFHGATDPQWLIIRLCRQLLDQIPTLAGPSPLRVLGSFRGVRQYHSRRIDPQVGCSGLLIPINGGYEITVHSEEPSERQNFSIAHEIVHTFFREACPNPQPSPQEERLCDLGAAELVMPEARVAIHLGDEGLSFARLDHCRSEFEVSLEAAARRAVDLAEEALCFLIATIASSPNQGEGDDQLALRVVRWWHSRNWRARVDYEGQVISLDSLAGQAFINQDQRQGLAALGITGYSNFYEIQARGYGYPLPGNSSYRQVVILMRDPAH